MSKVVTAKRWSDILTLVASIGLGVATIPELIKAIKKPHSIKGLSLPFLVGRGIFFVVLAVSLFILPKEYRVFNTMVIAWLAVWYVLFYTVLLIIRAKK